MVKQVTRSWIFFYSIGLCIERTPNLPHLQKTLNLGRALFDQ